MPTRKKSDATTVAVILAWSQPPVRLSATASVSPGSLSMSAFRSFTGGGASARRGLAQPLQVREPLLEVGPHELVHEHAEPAVEGIVAEVAVHRHGHPRPAARRG